jgi:exopolysaccharide production protein ExoQ
MTLKTGTWLSKDKVYTLVEIVLATLSIFIMNRRTWLCIGEVNKPLFYCQYGTWLDELVLLAVLVLISFLILRKRREIKSYIQMWKKNWLVIVFLVFGVLSFTWSVFILGTTQKVLQLVLTSILAAYFGFRFSNKQILSALFAFSFFIVFLSFLLVLTLPGAAIMTTTPHEGAWRGVTSHRNYLGSIAAFSSMIASLMFLVEKKKLGIKILATIIFLGCGFLIWKSNSATGLLLMAGLNILLLIYVIWINFWPKFKKWVKVGIISIGSLIGIAALFNLGKIFELVGRNSSLTGRLPLWKYLIADVINHNLLFGYGLGTVWVDEAFQAKLAEALVWPFLVVNGHNGFIDTLMYLGVLGLLLLIALVCLAMVKAVIHVIKNKTLISFLPLITIVYVIIANITISFFFEFETFHWALLLCFLFGLTIKHQDDTSLSDQVFI